VRSMPTTVAPQIISLAVAALRLPAAARDADHGRPRDGILGESRIGDGRAVRRDAIGGLCKKTRLALVLAPSP